MKPLVSIVIPHYNRDQIIRVAITSVLNQEFEDWECLIVDDGSSEQSKKSIRNFLSELDNKKISYFDRPLNRGKGANACRNFGVEKAAGEYIAFLDSDDSWPTDYLLESCKFKDEIENFSASYSGSTIYRDKKETVQHSRSIHSTEGLFDFLLSPYVIAQTSSYFLKKEIVEKVRFDECLKRHQDYDFFIRLGQQYNWSYNPNCKTFIDWSTIDQRVTDFKSCITVYTRHKDEFKNRKIQMGYLVSCLGMALRENANNTIIGFYQTELKNIGYRRKIGLIFMVNFPKLFKYYKKLTKQW